MLTPVSRRIASLALGRRYVCTSATTYRKLHPDMFEPEKLSTVFVDKDLDKRPIENIPFVKNLFKGTFDKVII